MACNEIIKSGDRIGAICSAPARFGATAYVAMASAASFNSAFEEWLVTDTLPASTPGENLAAWARAPPPAAATPLEHVFFGVVALRQREYAAAARALLRAARAPPCSPAQECAALREARRLCEYEGYSLGQRWPDFEELLDMEDSEAERILATILTEHEECRVCGADGTERASSMLATSQCLTKIR
jgi:hypothetical protein